MLAIRSMSSSFTLASTGTRTSRFSIIRSRSCSCTTLASIASVNSYLLEVIVIGVRGGKRTRQATMQGSEEHPCPDDGLSSISTSAQADDSIQTGIFSRLPLGSMTVTAPSPVLGRQMTRRVLPCSG